MDLLASLAQMTAPQGDLRKDSAPFSGSMPLEAEFANLTTGGVHLVVSGEPTVTTSEVVDTVSALDTLSELLERMTGVTGAVAAPADREGGDSEILAPLVRSGVTGIVVTHEAQTGEAGVAAGHEAQPGFVTVVATSSDKAGLDDAMVEPVDQTGDAGVAAGYEAHRDIVTVVATSSDKAALGDAMVEPVDQTVEAGVVAGHEAQPDIVTVAAIPVGQADAYPEEMAEVFYEHRAKVPIIPTKPVMVPHTQLEIAGLGQPAPTPLKIAENKISKDNDQQPAKALKGREAIPPRHAEGSPDYSKMVDLSKKVPLEIFDNRQVSGLIAAGSSSPHALPQNVSDFEPKQSFRETSVLLSSEPLSRADIFEFVNKPITAQLVAAPMKGQDLSASDSSRLSGDVRPVQINQPALFRQINDAVVTRRDEIVEIRLSPEELGRVRMILSGQDRNPHLTIWVDRPEVLEQMRRQADQLLQQFREQGLSASLDFRDGRQARDGSEQKLALTQSLNRTEKTSETKSLTSATELSRTTPALSGRQGINIRV